MEEVLTQLGLNQKEAKYYLFLLTEGSRTGTELAKELGENRTNVYMILAKLTDEGLIETDDSKVRKYSAADPEKLKGLIVARQQKIRQAHSTLNSVLPELSSIYSLGQHKPGVVYLEGLEGYKKSLRDMGRSSHQVNIFASSTAPENRKAWEALEKYALSRKKAGNHSRIVFGKQDKNQIDLKKFNAKGYDVRFWGEKPLEGEIAVYGNKVCITSYQSALIITVITNEIIANSFKTLFDQIWDISSPGSMNIR